MVRAIGLAASVFVLTGCAKETFFCDAAEDCTRSSGEGVCEPTGYCSFPDSDCESGRRYGDLAPSGLAGTCVPLDEATSSTTSTSSGNVSEGTAQTSGTDDSSSGSGEPPESTSSTTSTSGESSSSTGEPTPACCSAACSLCEDACTPEVLAAIGDGESLSVGVVGDTIIWATGYVTDVYTYDTRTDDLSLLVDLPHTITNLAVDDAYVYYLSFGEGFVGRISIQSGTQSLVTEAGTDYAAGFGQIALDDSNVYFALSNPIGDRLGGAFWAPKVPNLGEPPRRLGALETPAGIGVDDDFVFVSDADTGGLYRFAKNAARELGTMIGELPSPGPLVVTDEFVFAASGDALYRFAKDGSDTALLTSTGGRIAGMAADSEHLYVTDIQAGSVTRVSLSDAEPPEQIATSSGAWGIATSCDAVVWCENGTFSLMRQPK